jgi:small nuclear ribonucleoprotein (snRNP)-like protein
MNPSIANQLIYQADQNMLQSIHHCREKVSNICKDHMHKNVRIQTTAGETYEGTIVGLDDHFIYLDVSQNTVGMRAFYPSPYPYYPGPVIPPYNPYQSTVLPLVLYSLLAISLI